jgi:hypothetical protein
MFRSITFTAGLARPGDGDNIDAGIVRQIAPPSAMVPRNMAGVLTNGFMIQKLINQMKAWMGADAVAGAQIVFKTSPLLFGLIMGG